MADIDTKVLYLETPSVSAAPAVYTIGVRMKNIGIVDRATSGYVSVFDKATGLLVQTFDMASAVMSPDQEKQAYSSLQWDLSAALPGAQFIVSGAITSDGDMDPSNDILNPTTVTIIDAPPPPPPPVTAHASQHEDGGSDELNVTGLHGELADGQPFELHAAKHMVDGVDVISVESLPGTLAEAQLPTDHGNERHTENFLLESELTNHIADATPHDAATSLEKTAEKDQADGYAGLNADSLVVNAQLGDTPGPLIPTCNLNGARHWVQVVAGCAVSSVNGFSPAAGERVFAISYFPVGWLVNALGDCSFDFEVFGRCDLLNPGDTVTFRIYVWPTVGGVLPALHTMVWTAGATDNNVAFHGHLRATVDPANNQTIGHGDVVALDTGGGPNAESHVMPAETVSAWFNPSLALTAYATVQLIGANVAGHDFSVNLKTTIQPDY